MHGFPALRCRGGPPELAVKTITIFGSSLPVEGSAAYADAQRLGRLLAKAGHAVCNGGYAGLMEASARGAREAGGHTIGVTCTIWPRAANPYIVEEVHTHSFPQRLMTLVERGDAYVVLPGGTGTLAELALCWEIMNKRSLQKAMGGRKALLVAAPYWQPVIDCLRQEQELNCADAGSIAAAMDVITLFETPEQAVERLCKNF